MEDIETSFNLLPMYTHYIKILNSIPTFVVTVTFISINIT